MGMATGQRKGTSRTDAPAGDVCKAGRTGLVARGLPDAVTEFGASLASWAPRLTCAGLVALGVGASQVACAPKLMCTGLARGVRGGVTRSMLSITADASWSASSGTTRWPSILKLLSSESLWHTVLLSMLVLSEESDRTSLAATGPGSQGPLEPPSTAESLTSAVLLCIARRARKPMLVSESDLVWSIMGLPSPSSEKCTKVFRTGRARSSMVCSSYG
mmetsp:Transcript_77110/g.229756  ORF Transcript_77110/g.229756 Transcript_77110/m.229756 type:complete len:218 (+) Transcript_77110:517-1170(+)